MDKAPKYFFDCESFGKGLTYYLEALGQRAVEVGMRDVGFRLDALGALILAHRTDDSLYPACLHDPGPLARGNSRYWPAAGSLGGRHSAMAAVYATGIAVSLFGTGVESTVQGLSGDGTDLPGRSPRRDKNASGRSSKGLSLNTWVSR
jgi:hypothetical protein